MRLTEHPKQKEGMGSGAARGRKARQRRCLENTGCPVMQVGFLGKEESLALASFLAQVPFPVEI